MLYFFRNSAICIFLIISFTGEASAFIKSYNFYLPNGLQIVVIPNKKSTAVNHSIFYKAGSIDEPQYKTGIAHFLEHLMFKGTKEIPKGKFSKIISSHGGNDNAFTSYDYTGYYQNIPADKLEIAMKLEADRMQNLIFDPEEVEKELKVVIEERNMRVENKPQALFREQLKANLFLTHPYRNPVIGWPADLKNLNLEDARLWYQKYYNPANALVVIAGNVSLQQVKKLAYKYYNFEYKNPKIKRTEYIEAEHFAKIKLSAQDDKVANNEFYRYYLAPSQNYDKKEYSYGLLLLSHMLGESGVNILQDEFIYKAKIAVEAGSYYDDIARGPAILSIKIIADDKTNLSFIEEKLDDLLANKLLDLIDEEKLQTAKNSLIATTVYAQEDIKNSAFLYGAVLTSNLTADYIENWPKNIQAVSLRDIKNIIKYVFNKDKAVTGYLYGASK